MPPPNFPLRWESTGDQWWYASPIDWAAANGLYDLVSELLHLDSNQLIKLTSLRRIRRLETVWDDEEQFYDVAKNRSQVARKLLGECETKTGHNSLIRAGYGGWLLYTAASAGDVGFVRELLKRDNLLVFGEGEYGVTDLLYAAARSKNSQVFRLLLGSSISPGNGDDLEGRIGEDASSVFKWEMMNRAVHAAARGGNLEVLRELLGSCSDVSVYKDAQGSNVLHAASGRGQVEVVKYLVTSQDIITSADNVGNTSLHVAAYRGYLAVVEVLVQALPSLACSTNTYGNTFFHMAVAGFRTPGFRRLDRQIELMEKLVCGKLLNMEDIINVRNNEGRTALHLAVIENIQSNVVELLMTVPSIQLNIRDADGMTPLDLLKQRPKSISSEILIKQLVSAGGISICRDLRARRAIVSHMKMQGIGGSPGTSFRIPDGEIYLYMDIDGASIESCSYSSEIMSHIDSPNSSDNKKPASVNNAAKHLKNLLLWPRGKEKKSSSKEFSDTDSLDVFPISDHHSVPLRQRYSKSSSLPNNKRTASIRSTLPPSPSTKRNYAFGLMHGVINATPHLAVASQSPSSPLSRSAMSSPASAHDKHKGNVKSQQMNSKQSSFNKKLMNEYFCFGAQGLAVKESISTYTRPTQSLKHFDQRVMTVPNTRDSDMAQTNVDEWLLITSDHSAKWRYSAFHIVTAMVGAGLLSLPFAMPHLGRFFGKIS